PFVLKHQSMLHLREVPHCLGTLNPHKEEAVKVVLEMLRQVVELHPGVRTLHIGADEVYLLGEGEDSRRWLASPGRTVEQLFLDHVTKVAKAVKEAWPHVTVIMWDDMMREMSGETLKACGLVGLVQPMLWDYNPNLDIMQFTPFIKNHFLLIFRLVCIACFSLVDEPAAPSSASLYVGALADTAGVRSACPSCQKQTAAFGENRPAWKVQTPLSCR
uniref:beta-N-acetylhexosaminidase n=1 Tax=Oryzias sinensis TaxID=183150 RepID=A0A8C7YA29_9TELE